MSSRSNPINLSFYLALGGGFLVYHSLKQIKKKNHMKDMAKQIISAASAGSVEVEAIAWPLRSIDTSMAGEQIVFRHLCVQKLVKRGKSSSWETQWSKSTPEPFLVFDHSGFVTILPETTAFKPAMVENLMEKEYNPKKLTNAQIQSFESFCDTSIPGFSPSTDQGFFSSFFSLSAKFRILERSIPIGSPLLVHGYLIPTDTFRYVHVNESLALFKERVAKLMKNTNFKKTLFDKNKDGVIDLQELNLGFRATLKASLKNTIIHTDMRPDGGASDKMYGSITADAIQDLQLTSGFETQFLNNHPVFINWAGLTLGMILIGVGIFLFITQISS